MPAPRQGNRRRSPTRAKPPRTRQPPKQADRKSSKQPEQKPINNPSNDNEDSDTGRIDLSATIPLSLQQLLLDVFKTALLNPPTGGTPAPATNPSTNLDLDVNRQPESPSETSPAQLDTKSLVQTIKSHLYQRDFDSAFTDADEALLRVYSLRWSAARALGYVGIFKAVLGWMRAENDGDGDGDGDGARWARVNPTTRIVCIGGGAGAEVVALAAVWRDLDAGVEGMEEGVAGVSLEDEGMNREAGDDGPVEAGSSTSPGLDVATVDIADWSGVVERLSRTVTSADVPTPITSKHQPPLVSGTNGLNVSFHRTDVLSTPEPALKDVLLGTSNTSTSPPSLLVTLMFTLNELFSTSMAKTTGLLLQMTEILPPGATLLVVDSPGSYSTLKLGKGKDGAAAQERKYPMKFLLDHTLLSVAEGKWERVLTQDSRWWRRDAARLKYEVGDGAGLEDMRFQVHLYRRLK